jgi:MYXO-CTERM domain-containing protein
MLLDSGAAPGLGFLVLAAFLGFWLLRSTIGTERRPQGLPWSVHLEV